MYKYKYAACYFYFIIFMLLYQLRTVLTLIKITNKCFRLYPTQNLFSSVKIECRINPLSYSFSQNNSCPFDFIEYSYFKNIVQDNYLLFTIVDENSFKYLLNLYRIFFIPYNIYSLLTLVFNKNTFNKCIKYKIFCIKIKWPKILNKLETTYKKRVWFMKYIQFYNFIKNNISIIFIDSDIVFIQNCLSTIINNNNDIVLSKSQASQIFGNAGIVYIL